MGQRKINGRPRRRRSKAGKLPDELRQVNLNAAGIDVGAESHWVAVPEGRDEQSVCQFAAFTADLYRLAAWLEQCGVQTVVMESTGVYWISLFEVLEERGFEVLLADPHKLKQVPGRKTDVLDCQWLQQLHTFGLLAGAFRPVDRVCVLRSYLRQRAMLVRYASHHIQHMQKAMTQMNVKLQQVVSHITGATGMAIIRAILGGKRNPEELAKLRDCRCKNDEATIARALHGHYREEHLFELRQAVELFDEYQEKIAACDQRIEAHLATFDDQIDVPATRPSSRKRKRSKNGLVFDLRQHLRRVTGVDLTKIDGIDASTALTVISEIGLDMTRWRTVKHFTSWLGLCPGNKISGGKRLSGQTRPCANRAATALRLAANALHRSQSALGAFLRRKKAQLGAPKAITATAHKLARLVYTMLRYGEDYVDEGQEYYERRYRQRVVDSMKRKARAFGFRLVRTDDTQLTPAT
jgi:transposase